jgi:hypothetical protein
MREAPNVPDELSLLASGTKACSAGDVPEVPKAQGLAPSARWAFIFAVVQIDQQESPGP